MTKADFDVQINRVIRVHSKKNFGEDRIYTIWKMSNHLGAHEFSRIVDEMINDFRYAPLPKDFREAIQRRKRWITEDDNTQDPITCEKCLDTGLMEAHDDELCFTAFIRCKCDSGKKSVWKKIPEVTSAVLKTHRLSPPRSKVWIPDIEDGLKTKTRLWLQQIQISEEYWAD